MNIQTSITSYKTINPATGKHVSSFPEMTDAEVAAALDTAQHTYETRWQHESVSNRAAVVARAAAIMRE